MFKKKLKREGPVPVTSAWGFGYNEIFHKNRFLGDIKIKKAAVNP